METHNKIVFQKIIAPIFGLFFFVQVNGSSLSPSIFDVMNHSEVLDITLESDFSTFINNRRSAETQKALLTFEDENGLEKTWNLKIKLRGKFRRMNCEMPPLKLDFKKSELEDNGLALFDDLKLVTHCVADKLEAKELLLREYLAYKLYNELSEYSYRVQLVRITYKDTQTGKKERNWGFLIEDTAQLESRTGTEKINGNQITINDFETASVQRVAIFQYMIGNADWSLFGGRNVKFFKKGETVITIPYDFDFSGFVNAQYAKPNPDYDLTSVRERVLIDLPEQYRWFHAATYSIYGKKEVLLQTVKNFKKLSSNSRFEIIQYLNSYFVDMDNINFAEKVAQNLAP